MYNNNNNVYICTLLYCIFHYHCPFLLLSIYLIGVLIIGVVIELLLTESLMPTGEHIVLA
jgi:hypothetical protein